ncbi:TPA: ABC transporter ATP-binding protein, partial [Candidatus Acetothermia bacterium]|nr:ABC transporter ATP-binding protein [Candidatus Acetothermia bacterium]
MANEGGALLSVRELKKSYGSVRAVDGISFAVLSGTVFTILGPNGAGKTTSFYMIVGLVAP